MATDNDSNSTTSTAVNITVVDQNPSVIVTNPVENASFSSGDLVFISATASDLDGTVSQVEFFEGTTSLSVDTTSPYSLIWPYPADGAYVLTAVAIDNDSNSTTSTAVNITVGAILETYSDWVTTYNLTHSDGYMENYDSDSLNNLSEYALGGNPTNGLVEAGVMPTSGVVADGATNYLEYVYNRRADAESRNLTYEVQNTDDLVLGVWTNEVQEIATSDVFTNALGNEFESVTNRISMEGQTNGFAKLKITLSE